MTKNVDKLSEGKDLVEGRMRRLIALLREFHAALRAFGELGAARRPVFAARLAFRTKSADAASISASTAELYANDAGYVADRAVERAESVGRILGAIGNAIDGLAHCVGRRTAGLGGFVELVDAVLQRVHRCLCGAAVAGDDEGSLEAHAWVTRDSR